MTPAEFYELAKLNEPNILETLDVEFQLQVNASKFKYVPAESNDVEKKKYFDVKLLEYQHFVWLPEVDDDGNEKIIKDFNHICVWIWFPR